MNNPRILFADEPTGALNSTMSEEIMNILVNINKLGSTIVLVTHDTTVAAKANRILLLSDGEICREINLGLWDKKKGTLAERQKKLLSTLTKFGV